MGTRAAGANRPTASLLYGGAAVAVGDALASDLAFGRHPTHSVVLLAVVAVVAVLRRLGCRTATVFTAAAAALAAQPVLHLLAEAARSHSPGHTHPNLLHHLLVTELPTAGVQIVVPAAAVVAGTICAHLLHLLIDVVRRPRVTPGALFVPMHVLLSVRARRLGSMRRWCGWVLQAARRGPPLLGGYGIPRTV